MTENIRKQIEKELISLKRNTAKFGSAVEIVDEARNIAASANEKINKTYTQNKKLLQNTSDSFGGLVKKQEKQLAMLNKDLTKLHALQEKLSKTDVPEKLKEHRASLIKMDKQLTNLSGVIGTIQKENEANKQALVSQIKGIEGIASKTDKDLGAYHKQAKDLYVERSSELAKILKSENEKLRKEVNTNRMILFVAFGVLLVLQLVLFYFVG